MNTNTLISRGLVVYLILILASPARTQTSGRGLNSRSLVHVRRVDKVELLSIDYGNGYIEKVNATKLVEGTEVQDILAVWKQQKLVGASPSACHQPAYGIKFYSKGQLVLFATICWSCRNIDFVVPAGKGWTRFEADSRSGQLLKTVFTKAFPSETKVISCNATEQIVEPERKQVVCRSQA